MIPLDEKVLVAGQIRPHDIPAIAAAGVTMIVNNRPNGEEPGQPFAAEVEVAARAAGLHYRHVPVSGGLYPDQVQAMAEALEATEGKTLAFCRSGTRSIYLWALARANAGDEAEEIVRKAEAAGYDLTPIRAYLG
ncbi:MAG TPA: TIGR01244 family sulfur transferase [Allosphingosinicella sp.]|uniref:TIGR01244 family sulfur transferase n=1 Tax=Allosphingosinicella sp. TaxID=2823234 RepID=UPI002EDB3B2A